MKSTIGCFWFIVSMVQGNAQPSLSGTVYLLEAGTNGNQIELTIANQSTTANAGNVEVRLLRCPAHLNFISKVQVIDSLASRKERPVMFTFNVARTAPANKCDTLEFSVSDRSGSMWRKSVIVKYTGPTTFALDQNFPNPFNPTTTIQYQLPVNSKVTLKVYDVLGREVATLTNEVRPAGYHDAQWDAGNVASGVYFYRIEAQPLTGGSGFQQIKKLIVLK